MKKLFVFILSISFAITLSACGKQNTEDTSDTSAQNKVTDQQNATNGQDTAKQEDKNAFISIKDAMDKSIPLKCTYSDANGQSATMYFKGNVIRADAVKQKPTDPLISEIIKDNKIYIWSESSDQGMLVDFAKINPNQDTFKIGETPIRSTDDIVAKVNEQKQTCVKEDIADSMFEIPANVKFPVPGEIAPEQTAPEQTTPEQTK